MQIKQGTKRMRINKGRKIKPIKITTLKKNSMQLQQLANKAPF